MMNDYRQTYPITDEMDAAIRRLWDDPSVGHGLLGHGVRLCVPEDLEGNAGVSDRMKQLRTVLEGYVSQLAAEVDELGIEELPRLRAEATSLLVVLRELMLLVPEAFDGR